MSCSALVRGSTLPPARHGKVLLVAGALWMSVFASLAGTVPSEPVVSISFVGDVMLADGPGRVMQRGRDPFAPFAQLLKQSDIRVANLECVIATRGRAEPEKPYTFRAHPRALRMLKRHFDGVALANNHSGDFGPDAFAQMLGLLETNAMGYFGGGRNLEQAHAPWIVERNGLRIAFLGYNEFFPRSFEADFDKPGVAWSEDEQVVLDIRNARAVHHADVVIPMMHWGWEHDTLASPRQRQLARRMIDAGADAVVGGHPHVTQEVEHYNGKSIVYSLGNFVFDGFEGPQTTTGWLLQMEVARDGARAWKIHTGKIDRDGIPHPVQAAPTLCWSRDTPDTTVCPPAR